MGLDALDEDIEAAYGELEDSITVELDRETRHELAMLAAVLGVEPAALVQRGLHLLFQTTVDTGKLDFHLRGEYEVTYDEYLSGMTYDEMTGQAGGTAAGDDDRRYQF